MPYMIKKMLLSIIKATLNDQGDDTNDNMKGDNITNRTKESESLN